MYLANRTGMDCCRMKLFDMDPWRWNGGLGLERKSCPYIHAALCPKVATDEFYVGTAGKATALELLQHENLSLL